MGDGGDVRENARVVYEPSENGSALFIKLPGKGGRIGPSC
jgi:hypothetical protein